MTRAQVIYSLKLLGRSVVQMHPLRERAVRVTRSKDVRVSMCVSMCVTAVCRSGSYMEVAFMCPPWAVTALVGARIPPQPGLRMGRSSGNPEGCSWKGLSKEPRPSHCTMER